MENDRLEEVVIEKHPTRLLFEYMAEPMHTIAPDYADNFAGQYYGDVLSIIDLSQEYYQGVFELIMQACDQVPELAEYKTALQAALEADPRFKRVA
ncbi:MAG: hypothetical protein KA006_01880 [Neisseria sp.]|nr:hypothetical protein [Neisseria sp.]